ncbi:MAG TPA: GNAT family N-acetyltransferase, partial [Ilumatobacteraceae bacterium]|nr:GNAT family N-acetyltransferase [Ilumatobacteraceae bacterium]
DGDLVGFVMLARSQPGAEEPWLWRLLVDRMHQRRGIGGRIIELVADHCREWGDTALLTSWVPGKGSPEPMYLGRGFAPTGEVDHGEIVGRLRLR